MGHEFTVNRDARCFFSDITPSSLGSTCLQGDVKAQRIRLPWEDLERLEIIYESGHPRLKSWFYLDGSGWEYVHFGLWSPASREREAAVATARILMGSGLQQGWSALEVYGPLVSPQTSATPVYSMIL